IKARKILDSRGNWTVEVDLVTEQGLFRCSVPSGASTGKYEAPVVNSEKAVKNVNEIIGPKLKGKEVTSQKEIDNFLNPEKFGANATTPVSLAVCRAGASAKNLPLYQYVSEIYRGQTPEKLTEVCLRPAFNVINGGAHAGNELDFQEFMIVPQARTFSKNLQMATEIYQELKKIIKEKYIDLAINLGDEGGFAPPVRVPEEALNLILTAAKNLGYEKRIKIIIDVAASQFYEKDRYKMKIGTFTKEGLLNYYLDLIKKYPILGLEDPFAEDDWEGWKMLNSKLKAQSSKLLIIGDDLLVTNPKRMKMAKEKNACNGAIIKINQIGTLSKAIEAVRLAKSYNWKIMVSHRSGETNDDFIADFAWGIGADFIKAGAPARGERVAKYNRLLRIEEELK
ncbi:MAG: enolase, partial [Patescibacteria group bacterium]|nr:enolase [Patescibacteria group bacterium]